MAQFLSGFRSKSPLAEALMGGMFGVNNVLWAYTFASLIFTGALSAYLPLAVTIILISTAVVAGVVGLISKIMGHVASLEDGVVAILATVAILANDHIAEFRSVDAAAATMFTTMALVSLCGGLSYLLLARFDLGLLIQLMPFPVVCGFLAGAGWLFAMAGISMTTGLDIDVFQFASVLTPETLIRWVPALASGAGISILLRRVDHPFTLPLSLLACAALFFAINFAEGVTLGELRANDWFFGMAADAHGKGPGSLDFAGINWRFVLSVLPQIGAMIMISLLSASFSLSALELGVGRPIDYRHELMTLGFANIASAACLGLSGSSEVPTTAMAQRTGVNSRLLPIAACVPLGATALIGGNFIGFVPKMAMGALVFLTAVQFIREYLVDTCRQMAATDVATVWLIFGIIVLVGFIPGVLAGLILTSLLFIVRYSKIEIVGSSYSLNQISSSVERALTERAVLRRFGDEVQLFNLRGFLFFGTANMFFERMKTICGQAQAGSHFIFNFRRVTGIDSTAAQVFLKILNLLEGHESIPIFCALSDETTRAFERAGVLADSDCLVLTDPDLALKWVEERLLARHEAHRRAKSVIDIIEGTLDDQDKAEKLASVMECIRLEKGGYLFRQGDVETCAYLIQSGVIEIRLETEDGKVIRLREFRHGALVGEMAAYSANQRRSGSAIAIESAVVYRFDAARLKAAQATELEAALHELVARLLTARLEFMNERIRAEL